MNLMRRYGVQYLVVAVTALLVVGYFTTNSQLAENDEQTQQLEDQAFDLETQNTDLVRQADRLCNAVTALGNGVNSNTQSRIRQSEAFLASGQYADLFPNFSDEELNALIEETNDRDRKLIEETTAAVKLACG